MTSFKYTALDRTGKRIKGSLETSSMETAKSSLRQSGYTILEIYVPSAVDRDIKLPFLGNPKAKEMAVFCRQFASILRAGVPIVQILTMLGQQTQNAKLAAAVRQMQTDIEKGDTLAGAMSRHGRIFPDMLVNMVSVGEESGNLEKSFRQMEIYFGRVERTKAAVSKAMTYPLVLVAVMLIVLIVMMTKILPSFLKTFTEMDMELPAVTRAIMSVSSFFAVWWWLPAAILGIIIIFLIPFRRSDAGRHLFGRMALRIPVVRSFVVRGACAAFCRTLALLLASGLSLIESLELTANNMSNVYFREAVRDIAVNVARGRQLNAAIRETGLFPPMVYGLVAIGEESGDIHEMLEKAAEYYDDEVTDATQKLLGLMEPVLLIFLAVFVIVLVMAIFLPMMNMTRIYDSYL